LPKPNADSHGISHSYSFCDADGYCDGYRIGHSDSDRYGYGHCYGEPDGYCDGNAALYSDAKAAADAAPTPIGSDRRHSSENSR
jgi:hypothetical protein